MAKLRVLIVDNQRAIRRMIRAEIEKLPADLEIAEAGSGEEAQLAFGRLPLDLLITDLRLAGISGLELVSKFRQQHPRLKAILIASNPTEKTRLQVKEARAEALLTTPLEPAQLVEAVSLCLEIPSAPIEESIPDVVYAGNFGEGLEILCTSMGALAVLFLDEAGQVMAQAGDIPRIEPLKPHLPILMQLLNSSLRLSQSLGAAVSNDLFCFTVPKMEIYAAHVSPIFSLLVCFDSEIMGNTRARMVRLVSTAVQDLAVALPDIDLKLPPAVESPPSPVEVSPEVELEDLETVFHQATLLKFDSEDVDQFWETAVDEHNSDLPPGGSLSFDQAQGMGIVEEE
jgi:CheY-like chemotaxis protein